MSKKYYRKAIESIDKKGMLLVYPLKGKKLPASIWSELFPRTEMRWSWDEFADDKVGQVWLLKEDLSKSGEVVYGKWFKGRATFMSKDVFVALRAYLRDLPLRNPESNQMLEMLEMDSPLSTKVLRAEMELQGKSLESLFVKAARALWERVDIVGFGEVQDSAFPSMAFAAAASIFEEQCLASAEMSVKEAESHLVKRLGEDSEFLKFARKLRTAAGLEVS